MPLERSWRSDWLIPSAKLDISQPGKSVLDTLTDFYSQYGPIASIRSLSDSIKSVGFGYAIIELTDGRYAEVAIINDKINERYRLLPDVPTFRPDSRLLFVNLNAFPQYYLQSAPSNPLPSISNELQSPPEPESSFNIINMLNGSHLQMIFSHLLLADLCSVADVCTKFRTNAKITYANQFVHGTPEIDDVVRFESFARNFGPMIQSLSFNCWLHADIYTEIRKNAMLSILVKYFSGPDCRLQTLSLTRLDIDVRWHSLLAPIFNKLHYLRLDQSRISALICHCSEVVMLDVCYDVGKFTNANDTAPIPVLNNLERLILWETKDWRDILFRQLTFGERVVSLNIHDSEQDQDFQTICGIFGKFPQLEELHLGPRLFFNYLSLDEHNEMINKFQRMNNLSSLTLKIVYPVRVTSRQLFFGLDKFLSLLAEAHVPLEYLKFGHDVTFSELNSLSHFGSLEYLAINGSVMAPIQLMTMIQKLHRLKELRFNGQKKPIDWHKEDIKEMIQCGKRLQCLYFGDWQQELIIFENDFDEILSFIMLRAYRTKLTIIIQSIGNITLAIPADKIALFSGLLEFKMISRNDLPI